MPKIDLGPHEYTRTDPRTGKRVRDFSPRFCRNMTFVGLFWLALIFWGRNEGSPTSLFLITAVAAFFTGILAGNWLKDIY